MGTNSTTAAGSTNGDGTPESASSRSDTPSDSGQDDNHQQDSLRDIVKLIGDQSLPPVDKWQPERSGKIDIVIRRDGSWTYQGSSIDRKRMVKLFSTILRMESDNTYHLVTPIEKLSIVVEDAPFVVTRMEMFEDESLSDEIQQDSSKGGAVIVMTTNVDDPVIVDSVHSLCVEYTSDDAEPAPYLMVRNGLRAKLSRSVWYQLVDMAFEHDGEYVVQSSGTLFALGKVT